MRRHEYLLWIRNKHYNGEIQEVAQQILLRAEFKKQLMPYDEASSRAKSHIKMDDIKYKNINSYTRT